MADPLTGGPQPLGGLLFPGSASGVRSISLCLQFDRLSIGVPFTWEIDINDFERSVIAVMWTQSLMPSQDFTTGRGLRREARKPELAASYMRNYTSRRFASRDDAVLGT